MAGGIGSRFWPISRTAKPKQFLDLLGTGRTLIQWTYKRFQQLCPPENIYFITNKEYSDLLREQLPEVPEENIIAEPSRKNTAPCAAYFAHKIHALNPDANIILSPADHLILDERAFENTMKEALELVSKNDILLTLGIQPTRPDTGYGYIQYEQSETPERMYRVKLFTEKPPLELAKTFLKSGDFLWNSGLFIWNARTVLAAIKEFMPDMDELFRQVGADYNTPEETEWMKKIYPQCTNVSIDYGIMEKASNVYVIPSAFGWCDLGTWQSVYDNSEKDYLNNAVYGDQVMVMDAKGCMVKTENGKLVLLQGIENLIVIDTPDVLLICERNKEQQLREYVAEVKKNKGERYL